MPQRRFIPPRNRTTAVRDARLIIIAAEGTNTEKAYFDALAAEYFNPRVHVKVLDHLDLASAPEHVLTLLDGFRKEFRIRTDYDELWLVVDVDRWGEDKLSSIATMCVQKLYQFAVSNPCFEIWLLLHLRSLDDYDVVHLEEFRANRNVNDRTRLERELVALLGSYSKSHPEMSHFLPYVETAIARAQAIDLHPEQRWPNDLGSRVYRLAMRVISR